MQNRLNYLMTMTALGFVILAVTMTAATFQGCAQWRQLTEWYALNADNPLAIEAADTVGYGLGLLAAKDPAFRGRVEKYYGKIALGDITPAITNAALEALSVEGPEYRFLAHKIVNWLRILGAQFAPDGQVQDIGKIDPALLETGKVAYLAALAASGVK